MLEAEIISPDEQLVLAKAYVRDHDPRLEARLLRSQIRLVIKMARLHGRARDRDDLVQEGCIGVVQALRHFDPTRRVRVSTYAAWWIRAYQLRWMVANHRLVKIGKTAQQRKIFFQARSLRAQLEAAGVEATPAELAKRMRIDEASLVEDLRCIDAREVPIDGPVQHADEHAAADERLGAAEAVQVVQKRLRGFVATLEPRDRTIVQARWLSDTPTPLRELGRKLGVSRERVRQLETRLLDQMRQSLPRDLAA
jgi:RNA polymerase sigma-32 factor